MKKFFTILVLTAFGLAGVYKANAQYHNMGVQMDMVWPKGGGNTKAFNSLYGGFFYEYRFRGADVDVAELKDHFGIEFGINYTEFLFKKNWDLMKFGANNSSITSYVPLFGSNSPYVRYNNKGANLYVAPKFYVTVYPELVEMYLMGKVGYQYLNSSGKISSSTSNVSWSTESSNSNKMFLGAFVGFEVKLGTVFVGTNFGFDTNAPYKVMKNATFKQPGVNSPVEIYPFKNMDKMWGNLVLEFKVKALLNADK